MINRRWSVDPNTPGLKLSREGIQKLIRAINRFLWAAAPLPAHVAVFRHLGVERRFLGRDMTIICPAHNHMAQRIPLIP